MTESPTPERGTYQTHSGASEAELQAVMATLPIPVPWELSIFLDRLSAQRARPIELHPLASDGGPDMPTGLWIPTATTDHICYETETSTAHQQHIICHELGHMILGHEPDPQRPGQVRSRRIFQFLDPDVVAAARERTSYSLGAERDAEYLATMILSRSIPGGGRTVTAWDDTLGFAP